VYADFNLKAGRIFGKVRKVKNEQKAEVGLFASNVNVINDFQERELFST
jgi:hypothetical protein